MAVWTCLNFTNPRAATIIIVATSVNAMRFAMIFSSSAVDPIDISDSHCRSAAGVRTIRQIGERELMLADDKVEGPSDEADLRPLDDARQRELLDNAYVEQAALTCGER